MSKSLKLFLTGCLSITVTSLCLVFSGISFFLGQVVTQDTPKAASPEYTNIYYSDSSICVIVDPEDFNSSEKEDILSTARKHFSISFAKDTTQKYQKWVKSLENVIFINLEIHRREMGKKLDLSDLQVDLKFYSSLDEYNNIFDTFALEDYTKFHASALGNEIDVLMVEDYPLNLIELGETLRHELTHSIQFYVMEYSEGYAPTWYIEGMAVYYEKCYPSIVLDAYEKFDTLEYLDNSIYANDWEKSNAAYEVAGDFYAYLIKKYGEDTVLSIMTYLEDNYSFTSDDNFSDVFKAVLGVNPEEAYNLYLQSKNAN